MLDIIRRSGRSLGQAKVRTFLTASAIGVGAFALTLTLAASQGAQAYINKTISNNFNPAELIVTADKSAFGRANAGTMPQKYDPNFTATQTATGATTEVKQLSDTDLAKLAKIPNVAEVRPAVSPQIEYISGPNGDQYVASANVFSPAQKPDLYAGTVPSSLNNKQILVPESYVSVLGYTNDQDAVGQPITLVIQKAFDLSAIQSDIINSAKAQNLQSLQNIATSNTENVTFTIAAVYKPPVTSQPGYENTLYVGLKDAEDLADFSTKNTPSYHKYSYAYVRIQDGGTNAARLAAAQNQIKADGYSAQSVKDTEQFLNQIVAVLRGIVVAFGLIAIIASIFGIVNTMYISVLQRTREIGLMKALGMRKREIGTLFRVEAAWIGFLGGTFGSLLAYLLGTVLNPIITKKTQLGAGNSLLIFKPIPIIGLVLILMLVAILAGLLPARKAAKLDPIEALRTE